MNVESDVTVGREKKGKMLDFRNLRNTRNGLQKFKRFISLEFPA